MPFSCKFLHRLNGTLDQLLEGLEHILVGESTRFLEENTLVMCELLGIGGVDLLLVPLVDFVGN